jgi:hypothetical protein
LGWLVEHAVLFIGLHADADTEDIVDVAQKASHGFIPPNAMLKRQGLEEYGRTYKLSKQNSLLFTSRTLIL